MKKNYVTWVVQAIKRGRFEKDRQRTVYSLAVIAIVTLIISAYLLVASHTAVQARYIERQRAELLRLEAENELLLEQIGRESAVSNLANRATQLGFVPLSAGQVEILMAPQGATGQP